MKNAIFPIWVAAAVTACAQSTTSTNPEPSMLSEIYATKIPYIAAQRAILGTLCF